MTAMDTYCFQDDQSTGRTWIFNKTMLVNLSLVVRAELMDDCTRTTRIVKRGRVVGVMPMVRLVFAGNSVVHLPVADLMRIAGNWPFPDEWKAQCPDS